MTLTATDLFFVGLVVLLVILLVTVGAGPRSVGGIRGRMPPGMEGKTPRPPRGGSGTSPPKVVRDATWEEVIAAILSERERCRKVCEDVERWYRSAGAKDKMIGAQCCRIRVGNGHPPEELTPAVNEEPK